MPTMKTDTEETIRVTITLRRESHPEWYDRLVDVKSGRARADIMRTHLTLPRAVNASVRAKKVEDQPLNVSTTTADTGAVVAAPTPPAVVEALKQPPITSSEPTSKGPGLASLVFGKMGKNGQIFEE